MNIGGRTVVPAGSVMRGIVSSVEPASRTNRTARMTLAFDQLTVNGQLRIRFAVTRDTSDRRRRIKGESDRGSRVGAGLGAVIGGLLGGAKGRYRGAAIGGGGTVAATAESKWSCTGSGVRMSIDAPVQIQIR